MIMLSPKINGDRQLNENFVAFCWHLCTYPQHTLFL